MKLDYFYGGQTERVLKHLIRLFSNFSIQDGFNADGSPSYRRVPCRAGDISRQAAVVLNENSENKMPSAPFMTVTISGMELMREQTKAPASDQTVVGINRKDPATGQYGNDLEGYYEVERYNPTAWKINFDVDIWTTNQANKFELFEQIATVFSPTVPFQISTNPLDQTAFSYVEMKGYTHTSRSFPQGADYNLDISQFQFETTMYLSLPAKVNRAQLIHQIITDINVPAIDELELPSLSNWETIATDVYSPSNHGIRLEPTDTAYVYNAVLLTKYGLDNVNGRELSWEKLLEYYNPALDDVVEFSLLDQLEGDNSAIIGRFHLETTPGVGTLEIDPMTLEESSGNFSKYISKLSTSILNFNGTIESFIYADSADEAVVDGKEINPGDIITTSPRGFGVVTPEEGLVLENSATGVRYKYLKDIGWHELVKTEYKNGFWRISFR